MRTTLYRLIYRFINPYLPNSSLYQYFKWKTALTPVGTEFHQDNLQKNAEKLAKHFAGDTPLQPELAQLLPMTTSKVCKVLDVGAGPLSKVGKTHNGIAIELVPIDPLAKRYRALLESLDLAPKFWTHVGLGERLSLQLSADYFDLVHARNCIDHCLDPIKVIREAIKVLKPKLFFYMNYYQNEGVAAKNYGLHQWNFDVINGCFTIIDRFGNIINVNERINDIAQVYRIEKTSERLVVILQKL